MSEVPVTSDRMDAPVITVNMPAGTATRDDGTEEVIKTTLTTENGVLVALNDGDTWYDAGVQWATARWHPRIPQPTPRRLLSLCGFVNNMRLGKIAFFIGRSFQEIANL